MDTIYSNPGSTKTHRGFSAYYGPDINELVSMVLKHTQDENRKLSHETSVGAAFINALVKYVIGEGLKPNPRPKKDLLDWDDERYARFLSQAMGYFEVMTGKELDWYGRSTFDELQQTAFRCILISGDVLVHRCYSGRRSGYRPLLQLISGSWVESPDREDTKTCVGGVYLDRFGRDVAYSIKQTDEYLQDTFTYRRVERWNHRTGFEEFMLVKLTSDEANQVRGVPILTPIRNDIVDLQVFNAAHITKAQVNALLSTFITQTPEATGDISFPEKTAEMASIDARDRGEPLPADEDRSLSYLIGSGSVSVLNPGEDVKSIESQLAGTDYREFVNMRLDQMGGAIGVPRQMALGAYDASYSASRGTIGAAEKGFAVLRNNFASDICTPIYRQIIDHGIRTGAIDCPEYLSDPALHDAILGVTWIGPSPVVIDPTKEVNAYKLAVESGFIDRNEACQNLYGNSFSEVVDRLAVENRRLAEATVTGNDGSVDTSGIEEDEGVEDENTEEDAQ